MDGCKKELIESTAEKFTKMSLDNKKFILGYMLGVESEREKKETKKPRSA